MPTLVDSNVLFADSCKAPTEEDYNNGARKQQIVMELDMETWKVGLHHPSFLGSSSEWDDIMQRAIDIFDIKPESCVIPNREPPKELKGKWVG